MSERRLTKPMIIALRDRPVKREAEEPGGGEDEGEADWETGRRAGWAKSTSRTGLSLSLLRVIKRSAPGFECSFLRLAPSPRLVAPSSLRFSAIFHLSASVSFGMKYHEPEGSS